MTGTYRWKMKPRDGSSVHSKIDEPLLALSVTYNRLRARAADQVVVKGSAIYASDWGGC
jgi:hypothetical protein